MAKEKSDKDLEKEAEAALAQSANYFTPRSVKASRGKVIALILMEACFTGAIYTNYDNIKQVHPLLSPILLGAGTAALAQTFNQYVKHQLLYNRIFKFIIWGMINGCFTALWIDLVTRTFDTTVYRVLLDQLVGAPMFQLLFNILNSLWEHGELSRQTHIAFFRSLRWSYCFWPVFLILAFGFLDPLLMFPANCLATLVWNVILSKLV